MANKAQKLQDTSNTIVCGFSETGNGLLAKEMVQVGPIGSGVSISQSAGALIVNAGVVANSEWLARSKVACLSDVQLIQRTTLSQRVVNNDFTVALGDLVGENLAYVINSATSVTVSFPLGHPFDALSVGQSVELGGISGAAGIAGTATVASVAGSDVTFTVAGWPTNGAGTLTVWGWNAIFLRYSGTTATSMSFQTRRRGWNSTNVSATTNTTASGHTTKVRSYGSEMVALADSLGNSTTSPTSYAARGSSQDNLPDPDVPLYVWLRSLNGAAAPASSTSWTLGFWRLKDVTAAEMAIDVANPQAGQLAIPVAVTGTPGVSATGAAAHDAVISGSPVRIGARAVSANYTAVGTGDAADMICTLVGAIIEKPFSIPELDWSAVGPIAGFATATDVALQAAAGAGLRRYLTAITLQNNSATPGEVQLKDGATVIWRMWLPANQPPLSVTFPSPLKTTANAALNVQAVTAGMVCIASAQGYTAP